MSVLLDLPEDISHEILAEWVETVELGKIDVSLSSCRLRGYFLKRLLALPCIRICDVGSRTRIPRSLYSWIYNRGICLKHLVLTAFCYDVDNKLMFDIREKNILEIYVYCKKLCLPAMQDTINSCTSMVKLETNKASIITGLYQDILERLESLHVYESIIYEDGKRIIDIISKYCKHLLDLSLHFGTGILYSSVYAEIIINNPHLRKISILADDVVLQAIIDHCHQIESVHLTGDDLPLSLAGKLIKTKSKLTELSLRDKFDYTKTITTKEVFFPATFDNDTGPASLFSEIIGISRLEMADFSLNNLQLDSLLHHSASSLSSLLFGSYNHVPVETIKQFLVQCPLLTSLHFYYNGGGDLLSAFCSDVPNKLTELQIVGTNLNVTTVMSIIESCSHLETFFFDKVIENAKLIEQYKQLLVSYYKRNRQCNGSIQFNCILVNYNVTDRRVRLTFKDGIFKGTNVQAYLDKNDDLSICNEVD